MNCGKPNHFGVLLQLHYRKYAVWMCDRVLIFSLARFLSVSFKVAIQHPSRFPTHHPPNAHCIVRANYGEDKENLERKNHTPLGKNNVS